MPSYAPSLVAASWLWWVLVPAVGFVVLLFVVFPLAIFVTALVERMHLRQIEPAEPSKAATVEGHKTVAEAAAAGYQSLGVFTDGDRGIKEGILTLMLSPDQGALLAVVHGALAGRHRLVSRSPDGHLLATSSVTGTYDLTGLQHEKSLPDAPLPVLEEYHRERAAQWGRPLVPWDPARVSQDILAFERGRVDTLVAAGMARYVEPRQVYRYRLRGAAHVAWAFLGGLLAASSQLRESRARRQAHERRLRERGYAFPVLPAGSAGAPPSIRPPPGWDVVEATARDPARRPEFIRLLAERGVYVVTRQDRSPSDQSRQVVEHLDYVQNGVSVFPVFSSEERATQYVQRLPHDGDVVTYRCLSVAPGWLLGQELSRFKLVLNPGSDTETHLTPQDLGALHEVLRLAPQ